MTSGHGAANPDLLQGPLVPDLVAQVVDYAIVALDLEGTIVRWNAGAESMQGYSASDALGRNFSIFYDAADRRRGLPATLLRRARQEGHVRDSGWRVNRDGEYFWADVAITALHDDEGTLTGFLKVTRDRTAEHTLETRLRESETRLRLLVGQVVDYAIVALDPLGVIETWNLGAERLKGYRQEEAVGRSFAMLYTQEDQRSGLPRQLLDGARRRGRVEQTGWRVRRDGSRFWADVILTALRDERGVLTGFAKVTRDRSEVKRLEDGQDAFYAAFNHDFHTPITVIKGFAQMLRDAEEHERTELIDRIEAGADRLLSMVQGLVDFAKQRVAHADLVLDDIDIAHAARLAVLDLGVPLTQGRVDVGDAVALARANGDAIHRIVTNLVLNALKYSDSSSPVRVTFATVGDAVEMRVSDSGRGIHGDDLATIFDQFQRGRLAGDDGGSGLGLASIRELVELQAGKVWIESELGVGTTVVMRLPAALPESTGLLVRGLDEAAVQGRVPRPRGQAPRVFGAGQPTG